MSMIDTPIINALGRFLDLTAFRHQLVASNMANIDTPGYKDMRVLFRDLFYQTIGTSGSGNPTQLGAGVAVSSMPSMFTQGNVDPTGVDTDVAINDAGFFITRKDGMISYTRAGNFTVDDNDYLVTAEGQQVLGYPAVSGSISTGQGLMPLKLGTGTISPPTPTSSVELRTNLDAAAAVGSADGSYSTPITIYDSLGASHVLTFAFTKTGSNAWDYSISIPSADVGGSGNPTVLSSGTLTFNGNGNLTSPAADVSNIAITKLADGAADMTFDWKLYDGSSAVLTQVGAPNSTASTVQDGSGSGALSKFAIGSDGMITGTFSNGKTAVLGQVALAVFANEQGLLRTGRNAFVETLASGQAVVGAPGTGGRGTLAGGALELSNVDIAKEFAALIVAQRGFQANARAVTTFDQITQETINLKQ
jgi:flagellar hook protein FlgE